MTVPTILSWCVSAALAQDRSADIELVRPPVSPHSAVGIDSASLEAPGTVRAALFGQYMANPLVLEQVGGDELSVIGSRATALFAVSADVSERVGVRGSLPMAVQWGSDPSAYSANGAGLGDLSGGVRVMAVKVGGWSLGGTADLTVPSGRRDAWLGESGMRIGAGLVSTVTTKVVSVSGSLGAVGRSPLDLSDDAQLRIGSDMVGGAGVRWAFSPILALQGGAVGRFGFAPGTNAAEALVGGQLLASNAVAIDLMLGHGISNGVGASDARILAGVTIRREGQVPGQVEARPLPTVFDTFAALPEEEEAELAEIAPEPEWKPQELARVARGEVELREEIRFEVGSSALMAESIGIVDQVAQILAKTPDIVHVVIVGHASNEGTFEVNYRLSLDRAIAIHEALLRRGIHPDRLSVRAMGEITPATANSAERDELSRKVEFRITRALAAGEAQPVYSSIDQLPFNGEKRPILREGGVLPTVSAAPVPVAPVPVAPVPVDPVPEQVPAPGDQP